MNLYIVLGIVLGYFIFRYKSWDGIRLFLITFVYGAYMSLYARGAPTSICKRKIGAKFK